jgi:SPP1 gp7 family putative phage head morphogenesis protein
MPKKIPLTKTRQKWLSERTDPPMVQGKTLLYPDAVAAKFAKRLTALVDAMTGAIEREVFALFTSETAENGYLPTQDASISAQARILLNRLRREYTKIFNSNIESLITQMLNNTDKASKSSTAQSLKELSGGLMLKTDFLSGEMKEQFQSLVQDNVSLFKTIPATAFNKVEGAVYDSIVSGQGIKDLKPFFETFSNGTRNYAHLRAYDQTRRAFTTLNMARLQKNGIKRVQWIHSHGSNDPRKLHQELDGQIFDIDKPPFIGVMYGVNIHAFGGTLPNCRCQVKPVFDFAKE